jgi:hypothetical protein
MLAAIQLLVSEIIFLLSFEAKSKESFHLLKKKEEHENEEEEEHKEPGRLEKLQNYLKENAYYNYGMIAFSSGLMILDLLLDFVTWGSIKASSSYTSKTAATIASFTPVLITMYTALSSDEKI